MKLIAYRARNDVPSELGNMCTSTRDNDCCYKNSSRNVCDVNFVHSRKRERHFITLTHLSDENVNQRFSSEQRETLY